MDVKTELSPAPGVLGSILDDPQYQTNAMHWKTQQAYEERGRPLRLLEPVEHARTMKLLDALANKNFEALKSSPKVLGLKIVSAYTNGLLRPEFNLLELAAVYDAEPLVRKAITRQLNLWFKQGFQFISRDTALCEYIRKRFKSIAYVTGQPTIELFKMIVTSLLKYSNAFVIKVRDPKLSTGISHDGKGPVAGYFCVSPLNMFPKYRNGKLEMWIRFLKDGSRFWEFMPEDVIHLTIDREPDFLFGKPRLLGVIEDIAALRRIEENVEVLISKFLFPVYQLTVGTPEVPCKYYNDGSSEIDLAKTMVQNMEAEGMLITSERFELDIVGARAEALDIKNYLEHFKKRVYAGLGVSAVDMGEGDTANRATADNISQNLKDLVVEDQLYFAAQIQHHMFGDLFLEHPQKISALNAFDQVTMRFAHVDMDNLIKMESHAIQLWNNDLITQDEGRQLIGRDIFTDEDRNNTRFHLIDVPLAIISARDEPYTAEAKKLAAAQTKKFLTTPAAPAPGAKALPTKKKGTGTGAGTGPMRTKSPAPKIVPGQPPIRKGPKHGGLPANITGPANQHGKNPGPAKAKSSFEAGLIGTRLADLTTALVQADSIDDMAEAIAERFPDNTERQIILPVVEAALKGSPKRPDLRANLVSGFVVISDMFPDIDEEIDPDAEDC
jgi:hypothetical protein